MPLIHTYEYGDGGIGDFIRSVFAYFVFCRLEHIEYSLYFGENPYKFCFNSILDISNISNKKFLKDIGGHHTENTLNILKLIKNNPEINFIIRSNIFDFISFEILQKYKKEFIKFLGPKTIIQEKVQKIQEKIKEKEFVTIHVRCGDAYMNKVNIACDTRINPNDENLLVNIQKCYYFLKYKHNLPVVFLTDNELLRLSVKKELNDIIIFNSSINHTAIPGSIENVIDTVCEFFLIGKSKYNVAFSNSGFPFWASFIYNVPLSLYSNSHLNALEEFVLKY